ncbi:MAG: phage major capsid protein [Clostridiales bacterium]|nr:phage major capsid protein [Clostridiales bacterium]
MTIKELLEKRSKLLSEIDGADEKRFAEIKLELDKIDFQMKQAEDEERKKKEEAEERAAREKNANGGSANNKIVLFTTEEEKRKAQMEEIEKRASSLKKGEKITVEERALSSSSVALGTATSNEINPAFEQVGTLDKLVNVVHLEGTGAESYKKPFMKNIGEGEIVKEGQSPSTSAEPEFDYAEINKVKIVAYAEINEEIEKLPSANYLAEVDKAVLGAWRKKVIEQMVKGQGSGNSELVGIVNAPEKIIAKSQKKTTTTIDENTLDSIIFAYGGDENVEGDATLILNKLTLKEFAKVKGSDKRRAYDIVVRGNSGTINGIPFVCTSKLPAYGDDKSASTPYMIYGKLQGYELAYFTYLEVEKSKDYKFKEGVICLKVSGHVGGSPAMYNGFMTVSKNSSTQPAKE